MHVKRLPHGAYVELHRPLGRLDDHGHPMPLPYQGAPVPKRLNKLGLAGSPGQGSLLTADPLEEQHALAAAAATARRRALVALGQRQDTADRSPNGSSTVARRESS